MFTKIIVVSLIFILISVGVSFAQHEKGDIREGNRLFKSEKFEESEVAYRKALDAQNSSIPGNFNLGDALYRQEKFEEAGKLFSDVSNKNASREVIAQAYHNLGNSFLQDGKLDEGIEAYKNALRQNPVDMETKYNLAYAQNLKKQQEEQEKEQKQDKDQDQDQEKEKDQDKEQDKQDNQDQQDKEEDKKKQEQEQEQEQEQQQQQQQQPKISKEDAQRLLDALANDEKKTQKKVKLAKAKAKKVRTLKEW